MYCLACLVTECCQRNDSSRDGMRCCTIIIYIYIYLLVVCSACVQSNWSCNGEGAPPPIPPHRFDQNPAPLARRLRLAKNEQPAVLKSLGTLLLVCDSSVDAEGVQVSVLFVGCLVAEIHASGWFVVVFVACALFCVVHGVPGL